MLFKRVKSTVDWRVKNEHFSQKSQHSWLLALMERIESNDKHLKILCCSAEKFKHAVAMNLLLRLRFQIRVDPGIKLLANNLVFFKQIHLLNSPLPVLVIENCFYICIIEVRMAKEILKTILT